VRAILVECEIDPIIKFPDQNPMTSLLVGTAA